MDEAAGVLRISRRRLQEIVKIHRFYFANGARKLFTEGDLAAIIAALQPTDPPRPRHDRVARSRSHSQTDSLEARWVEAQDLLRQKSKRPSRARGDG